MTRARAVSRRSDIVSDLTVVTVSETALFLRQWATEAGTAERADLAALKEEVRQVRHTHAGAACMAVHARRGKADALRRHRATAS